MNTAVASLRRFLCADWGALSSGIKPSASAITTIGARDAGAGVTEGKRGFAIHVEDVEMDFGSFPALRNVTLDIAPGELVALLGPSGSGKTTLLRVIAGLSTPGRGTVLFNGEDATKLSVQDRRVGFVFQNYALFKHLTVAENIAFGLKARPHASRPSKRVIDSRVKELLELVQLDGLGSRYSEELSGGQRQRVALARALAIEPRVLLLDEPFGALDARVRKDLRRWLRDVHKKTRITTVFVTHDQDEAMELADRVAILNEGRIEQIGTPEELYDRPASPFVISFVGEAVALPVKIANGHVFFDKQEIHIDTNGLQNGPARVFFRPSDIVIAHDGEGEFEGRVESLRRTPGGVRATIAIDGHDQTFELDSSLEDTATLGARVSLSLSKAQIFPSYSAAGC
jgi:sulfate transport system ATP-binding protein